MSIPFTWVYLIYDPFTNLFKIGKADDPERRHKELCRTNSTILAAPQEYELLEAWCCPEKNEGVLHDCFKEVRVRGEWFDLYKHFSVNPDQTWDIETEIGQLLHGYPRYIAEVSVDEEERNYFQFRAKRLQQQNELLQTQITHSRLLGYSIPHLLLNPAPGKEETAF